MTSTTYPETGSRPGIVRRTFRAIGDAMVICMERQGRLDQVERLRAKSDAELAEIGLKRNDIVRHVFRDRLFV
jgi:uncharacterized protein YjiS (DUF1127 family)